MAKRMIGGVIVDPGPLPLFAKQLGFKNASEVTQIAQKYGKIVSVMKIDDVVEWFMELNK